MDIERMVTNITNRNVMRLECAVPDYECNRAVINEIKNDEARKMLSRSNEAFMARYPDAVQWEYVEDHYRYGQPSFHGFASLVMMDEHTFRERIKEALLSMAAELARPEINIKDAVEK